MANSENDSLFKACDQKCTYVDLKGKLRKDQISFSSSCLSSEASSQKGTYVDLKGKLKKDERAPRNEQKKIRFFFVDVIEGGPLHQSGIRDGDELTTVNYAEVKSFHGIYHIASAIRECSSAIMLGMRRRRSRRRRRIGSVPFVVLFQLGDEDANPVHKFSGFYWNVLPRDIPFIPSCCKCDDIVSGPCPQCVTRPSVEVVIKERNEENWLTFNSSTEDWTFERKRAPTFKPKLCSTFQLEVCSPAVPGSYTTVAFRPQNSLSLALEATSNNELTTSSFNCSEKGQFFNEVPLGGRLEVNIQSALTNWYLGKDKDGNAVLRKDKTPICLYDTSFKTCISCQ